MGSFAPLTPPSMPPESPTIDSAHWQDPFASSSSEDGEGDHEHEGDTVDGFDTEHDMHIDIEPAPSLVRAERASSDSGASSSATVAAAAALSPGTPPCLTPAPPAPVVPRLTRAFSMPMPAQLRHLQHPLVPSASSTLVPGGTGPSDASSSPTISSPVDSSSVSSYTLPTPYQQQQSDYFHCLSLELADSVQPIIQTLLQLSPPHILDPAKEQFSACTVQIPTASVSGLLTAMKGLNFLSARLGVMQPQPQVHVPPLLDPLPEQDLLPPSEMNDFDIGELLQSVGDVLEGLAAQAGVDLVLFHGDAAMQHVSVRADEGAIAYALAHVLRQILTTCTRGDSLEIGLHLSRPLPRSPNRQTFNLNLGLGLGLPSSTPDSLPSSRSPSPPPPASSPPIADPDALVCTFDITHRMHARTLSRPEPNFSGPISARLLASLHASLTQHPTDPRHTTLVLPLRPCPPDREAEPTRAPAEDYAPGLPLAREPTLGELAAFARAKLKGQRAALYAAPDSAFGRCVTGYLTAWGMDVAHVPTGGAEEPEPVPDLVVESPAQPEAGVEAKPPPTFVIIDDDVLVLRRRLYQARVQPPLHMPATTARGSKVSQLQQQASPPVPQMPPLTSRPSLAQHHRPRSTPRSPNPTPPTGPTPPSEHVVIIHFTSLANYKLVRDAVQTLLSPPHHSHPHMHLLPDVLVVPKPAGPRRLLTALHTAVYKPLVDPFFAPIATSPLSPAGAQHPLSPFFTPAPDALTPPSLSSTSLNTVLTQPTPASLPMPMPMPMPMSNNPLRPGRLPMPGSPLAHPLELARPPTSAEAVKEYFPESAVKLGNAAASGVILQSPNGRPAGVFFQPQTARVASGSGSGAPVLGQSSSAGSERERRLTARPLLREGSLAAATTTTSFERRRSGGGHGAKFLQQGTIFSPSQVIDAFISTPTGEVGYTPPIRRSHTHMDMVSSPSKDRDREKDKGRAGDKSSSSPQEGQTRPFLLPSSSGGEESADPKELRMNTHNNNSILQNNNSSNNNPAGGGTKTRTRARRLPSAEAAANIPLPPSRPGSTRIPSGGSSARATLVRAARRNSAQKVNAAGIVHASAPPTAAVPTPVPGAGIVEDGEPLSPLAAQRANIRKLIQAGTSPESPDPSPPPAPVMPSPLSPPPAAVAAPSPPVSVRRSTEGAPVSAFKKSKAAAENVIVPPINVLIVEDNPINQTILSVFMRKKKIKYGTAKDGAEAVEKWRTGGYHLILMDIQMPVMDGIEATKEIRRLEGAANVSLYPTTPPSDLLRAISPGAVKPPATPGGMPSSPHRSSVIIVALTASSLQSDRVNALAAGCNDFLTKPVSLKWLEKKIIEWGSIKALQMWADSAVTRSFSSGQAARATKVREQLRIERPAARNTPSPGPPVRPDPANPVVHLVTPSPDLGAAPSPPQLAHSASMPETTAIAQPVPVRPAPGPNPLLSSSTPVEADAALPLAHPVPVRPAPNPNPLISANQPADSDATVVGVGTSAPIVSSEPAKLPSAEPHEALASGNVRLEDRRAVSTSSLECFFPPAPEALKANPPYPLSDVVEDSGEDSPAETVKAVSPALDPS